MVCPRSGRGRRAACNSVCVKTRWCVVHREDREKLVKLKRQRAPPQPPPPALVASRGCSLSAYAAAYCMCGRRVEMAFLKASGTASLAASMTARKLYGSVPAMSARTLRFSWMPATGIAFISLE